MRTLIVENFFSLMRSRAGKPMPVVLEFGNQFLPTCWELLKRISTTAFVYFTSKKLHYALTSRVGEHRLTFPKKSHKVTISKRQRKEVMNQNQSAVRELGGQSVPQNTTRRQFCMYKAGTIPLDLYENEKMAPMKAEDSKEPLPVPIFGEIQVVSSVHIFMYDNGILRCLCVNVQEEREDEDEVKVSY